jgi:hypothetical protein
MIKTSVVIALCLFSVSACKKKKEDGGTATAGASDKPKEMTATDLWNDYNKPGQDGMALMEKWRAGVIVLGSVKTVVSDNSVWLEGAGHNVQLDFTDPTAVKAKGIKAADAISAQCKIGGSDGKNLMMLTDCVLK